MTGRRRGAGFLLSSSLTTVCNPVDSVGPAGDFSRNSGDFPRSGHFAIASHRTPCQTHTQPNHLPCSLPRGEEPAGSAENRETGAKRLRRRRAEGSARIDSTGAWKQEPGAGSPVARQAGLLRTEPEPPEAAAIGRDRDGSEEPSHLCGVARPLEKIRTEAPRSRPAQAGKLLGASLFPGERRREADEPTGASRRAAGDPSLPMIGSSLGRSAGRAGHRRVPATPQTCSQARQQYQATTDRYGRKRSPSPSRSAGAGTPGRSNARA